MNFTLNFHSGYGYLDVCSIAMASQAQESCNRSASSDFRLLHAFSAAFDVQSTDHAAQDLLRKSVAVKCLNELHSDSDSKLASRPPALPVHPTAAAFTRLWTALSQQLVHHISAAWEEALPVLLHAASTEYMLLVLAYASLHSSQAVRRLALASLLLLLDAPPGNALERLRRRDCDDRQSGTEVHRNQEPGEASTHACLLCVIACRALTSEASFAFSATATSSSTLPGLAVGGAIPLQDGAALAAAVSNRIAAMCDGLSYPNACKLLSRVLNAAAAGTIASCCCFTTASSSSMTAPSPSRTSTREVGLDHYLPPLAAWLVGDVAGRIATRPGDDHPGNDDGTTDSDVPLHLAAAIQDVAPLLASPRAHVPRAMMAMQLCGAGIVALMRCRRRGTQPSVETAAALGQCLSRLLDLPFSSLKPDFTSRCGGADGFADDVITVNRLYGAWVLDVIDAMTAEVKYDGLREMSLQHPLLCAAEVAAWTSAADADAVDHRPGSHSQPRIFGFASSLSSHHALVARTAEALLAAATSTLVTASSHAASSLCVSECRNDTADDGAGSGADGLTIGCDGCLLSLGVRHGTASGRRLANACASSLELLIDHVFRPGDKGLTGSGYFPPLAPIGGDYDDDNSVQVEDRLLLLDIGMRWQVHRVTLLAASCASTSIAALADADSIGHAHNLTVAARCLRMLTARHNADESDGDSDDDAADTGTAVGADILDPVILACLARQRDEPTMFELCWGAINSFLAYRSQCRQPAPIDGHAVGSSSSSPPLLMAVLSHATTALSAAPTEGPAFDDIVCCVGIAMGELAGCMTSGCGSGAVSPASMSSAITAALAILFSTALERRASAVDRLWLTLSHCMHCRILGRLMLETADDNHVNVVTSHELRSRHSPSSSPSAPAEPSPSPAGAVLASIIGELHQLVDSIEGGAQGSQRELVVPAAAVILAGIRWAAAVVRQHPLAFPSSLLASLIGSTSSAAAHQAAPPELLRLVVRLLTFGDAPDATSGHWTSSSPLPGRGVPHGTYWHDDADVQPRLWFKQLRHATAAATPGCSVRLLALSSLDELCLMMRRSSSIGHMLRFSMALLQSVTDITAGQVRQAASSRQANRRPGASVVPTLRLPQLRAWQAAALVSHHWSECSGVVVDDRDTDGIHLAADTDDAWSSVVGLLVRAVDPTSPPLPPAVRHFIIVTVSNAMVLDAAIACHPQARRVAVGLMPRVCDALGGGGKGHPSTHPEAIDRMPRIIIDNSNAIVYLCALGHACLALHSQSAPTSTITTPALEVLYQWAATSQRRSIRDCAQTFFLRVAACVFGQQAHAGTASSMTGNISDAVMYMLRRAYEHMARDDEVVNMMGRQPRVMRVVLHGRRAAHPSNMPSSFSCPLPSSPAWRAISLLAHHLVLGEAEVPPAEAIPLRTIQAVARTMATAAEEGWPEAVGADDASVVPTAGEVGLGGPLTNPEASITVVEAGVPSAAAAAVASCQSALESLRASLSSTPAMSASPALPGGVTSMRANSNASASSFQTKHRSKATANDKGSAQPAEMATESAALAALGGRPVATLDASNDGRMGPADDRHHLVVVLSLLEKPQNIGACLRTCEAMGVSCVVIDSPSTVTKSSFTVATSGAHKAMLDSNRVVFVPEERLPGWLEGLALGDAAFLSLLRSSITSHQTTAAQASAAPIVSDLVVNVVAVEQTSASTSLHDAQFFPVELAVSDVSSAAAAAGTGTALPDPGHPRDDDGLARSPSRSTITVLVMGHEVRGVPPSVLSSCHSHVEIPQTGDTASLNVGAAMAMVVFEWGRQKRRDSEQQRLRMLPA